MMSSTEEAQRQQVKMSNRAAAIAFGFSLVLRAVVCEEVVLGSGVGVGSDSTLGDEDCLYESEHACLRAEAVGCVWCDLPRRCYSAARSLELGEFCTRKKSKVFIDTVTCDEIADSQLCSQEDRCRWCRSDKVDDGCFDEIEALRLPKQIFSCALVSLASSSTTVLGAGL